MPNNQPLPRPNLPSSGAASQPNQVGQANQAAQTSQVSAPTNPANPINPTNPASPTQPTQPAQSTRPRQTAQPTQSAQPQSSTQPPKATGNQVAQDSQLPAGLDRFAPGGAPPTGKTPDSLARGSDPSPKITPDQPSANPVGSAKPTGSGNVGPSSQPPTSGSQAALGHAPGQTPAQPASSQTQSITRPPAVVNSAQNQSAQNQSLASGQPTLTTSSNTLPQGGGNISPSGGGQTSQPSGQATSPQTTTQSSGLGQTGAPPIKPPSSDSSKKEPVFAQVKKNPLKFLPFVLGGLVIIGVVIFLITRVLGGGASDSTSTTSPTNKSAGGFGSNTGAGSQVADQEVVLTYWGLWEPSTVLEEVLSDFEDENPSIQVDYRKQSHKDYRERLQSAIASGNGPDLFRFHATWMPMLKQELSPMPSSIVTPAEYKQTYYPVMVEQLQSNGQFVGIPLMYDGLALYYNKNILRTLNEQPPTTWSQLRLLAGKLTVKSESGQVERGGLAIGNTTNVEHFSDILGLLILQNGGDPSKPVSSEVRDAIKFYTSFAGDNAVYSSNLPQSSVAFAREEVAMIFAPSWRVFEIQNINPDLEFGIVPVPKLSEQEVAWASYWAEGVSSQSQNQEAAWKLLKYISSPEVLKKLYSAQSQIRAFGEIYPRTDMADELNNPLVTPFLEDAPQAQSWYLCSQTHDNGLNDQMIQYYQDAVNSVQANESIDNVLETLRLGVTQVLRQYGISQQ
ncbi:MAG: extracellular solute-binding protein [Candidatus Pacebacteria bacterium]|nr:extracellular solute-binding protein [Candidatus Paceibacterota bacterium]